ncbi:hypothetical protein OG21DRAFT_1490523 [Imleria badia]|nr:hypothetical protein OG21DRAFT_1490523 [Imleria badia]
MGSLLRQLHNPYMVILLSIDQFKLSMLPPDKDNVLLMDLSLGKENEKDKEGRELAVVIPKSSTANRVLGNYTLTKTLGAGSMGKVKLTTHNVTDEKVPRHKDSPPRTPFHLPNGSNASPEASKGASKEIETIREAATIPTSAYVSGGQMLNYIISHGRLRERVARKFAHQIGSALDYCSRNNVVHWDLKIENILISKTGKIKIIDFSLSNLYDPAERLSTFCGSLYFAAPELLNAKVYTGPEVDVWSFGVLLCVLVYGKVPFDDQNMPALHVSVDLSSIQFGSALNANTYYRACWSPTLRHAPLWPKCSNTHEWFVIQGMKGFEFGFEEEIERKLVAVLESSAYICAVATWDRKRGRNGGRWGESFSNSSLAISFDSSSSNIHKDGLTPSKKSKHFSEFDFYRRKLFPPASSPPMTPSQPNSQSHLSITDPGHEPVDPTCGFHPPISISQISIQSGAVPSAPAIDEAAVLAEVSQPIKREPQPPTTPASTRADYSMPLPRLPAPETLHCSGMSYDAAPATASLTAATFQGQPRARDVGLPPPAGSRRVNLSAIPTTPTTATPLPHAPPTLTHRRSHSLSQHPTVLRGLGRVFGGDRKTSRRTRQGHAHAPHRWPEVGEDDRGVHDGPLSAAGYATTILGGVQLKAATDTEAEKRPVVDVFNEKSGTELESQHSRWQSTFSPAPPMSASQSQPLSHTHRRAATILDPQRRAIRHEQWSSTGDALLLSIGGSIGRHRRPSTGYGTTSNSGQLVAVSQFGRTEEVEENAEHEMSDSRDESFRDADKDFKFIHLKGLFSVSTTSTKPPSVLKADIKKVLDRMQAIPRNQGWSVQSRPSNHRQCSSSGSNETGITRSLIKKASKLSFGVKLRDRESMKDKDKELPTCPSVLSATPSSGSSSFFNVSSTAHMVLAEGSWHVDGNGTMTTVGVPLLDEPHTLRSHLLTKSKVLLPIPRDSGTVDREVFETISANSLSVRFEINIIKVLWLPLHGVQFRRAGGDGWQHQMLAWRVLTELKL